MAVYMFLICMNKANNYNNIITTIYTLFTDNV